MFIHYRTQGFVLKKDNRGEANQLFTIYTKEFGKIKILGKAIRKSKSKLRGAIELFYLSEIEFIQGKIHKTLTDAVLIESFSDIKKDLEKLSVAYKISEVLDILIKGQEADAKIWQLLNETFNKLNDWKNENSLKIVYYYFLWNFLSVLGYQPELYNCCVCRKKLTPEKLFFNQEKPGIICNNCFKALKSGKEINSSAVKILRLILEKNWQILSKLKIDSEPQKSLNIISKEYYLFIINNQTT
ncbi:DNA repair protein RecO [Candidatus Parcubacteria bacterium]|nr:DNA repair protein RecO [Candidatus Parcubacteria bacterium]